jgi:hypothetical protein
MIIDDPEAATAKAGLQAQHRLQAPYRQRIAGAKSGGGRDVAGRRTLADLSNSRHWWALASNAAGSSARRRLR